MELQERNIQTGALVGLIAELERGIVIIHGLSDVEFAAGKNGESSVGAHIRHNLDFVNALLNGINERRVDYNARLRDPRVENDRRYAIENLTSACSRLAVLTTGILASLVLVRSEVDEDLWHTSSVSREIEFLHSHTVHHYAIVARLVDVRGSSFAGSLGVAPSTLRYRGQVASN